jgi:hypothetical protein
MKKIRNYNASFSFISFNATTDTNISKNNIYTLRIQGMIHHRIGPLIPEENSDAKCAQIYIHGDDQEKLRQKYSASLNACTLIQLQAMLLDDCSNPFVLQFKKASQLLKNKPSLELKIVIITNKETDRRVYNKPTSDEIAVLIPNFGESTEPTKREAIVFEKNGGLKMIDTNKACYDPLQYPLIFPSGQLGWEHNSIKLTLPDEIETCEKQNDFFSELSDEQEDTETLLAQEQVLGDQEFFEEDFIQNELEFVQEESLFTEDESVNINQNNKKGVKKKMKYVSAMQYYAYQLCDRPGSYIHRFGRLFHQYIVDQFSKIELGRLNFFRFNQDKIRADLYQNIKDCNPDQFGKTIGLRKLLPSTYKGNNNN